MGILRGGGDCGGITTHSNPLPPPQKKIWLTSEILIPVSEDLINGGGGVKIRSGGGEKFPKLIRGGGGRRLF